MSGFDIVDQSAYERPFALLAPLRAAVENDSPVVEDEVRHAIADVRGLVSESHRAEFDDLLAEARLTFRIKDERGLYNDMPRKGIARRAVLEAGRRLAAIGPRSPRRSTCSRRASMSCGQSSTASRAGTAPAPPLIGTALVA